MNAFLTTTLLAATLSLAPNAAVAHETMSESRSVDARVLKVKMGGKINLHLTQGPTASLKLHGHKDHLAKIKVTQTGDMLHIDSEKGSWSFGGKDSHEVRAELTLPNLNELVSAGVGATEVQGFSGEQIKLVLDGAGSVNVDSQYRNVDVHLGGVGSMNIDSGNSDQVALHMRGAGQVTLNGNTKLLRAKLGGVGSLDAKQLKADAVDLDMSGMGSATVHANTSAKLNLNGLGSAKVYGNPANRNATARGLGSISWL